MASNRCGTPSRVIENVRSPPLVLRGGLRERQDHNLLRCRRRLRGRVSADTPTASPGTGVCRDPRNAILGAFLRVVLARIYAKFAQEVCWGYWGTLEVTASPGRKAQRNEGDLRAELSIGSPGRPAAVPFSAAAISMSTKARCSDAARAVTSGGEGAVDSLPSQSGQARWWDVKTRCQGPVEQKGARTRVKARVGGRVFVAEEAWRATESRKSWDSRISLEERLSIGGRS